MTAREVSSSMALPKDFEFSDISSVHEEGARRAGLMFGENWRSVCTSTVSDVPGGRGTVDADGKSIEFSWRSVSSLTKNGYQDLPDGSPAVFGVYRSGAVSRTARYVSGIASDALDGSPAIVQYSESGEISGGFSVANGQLSASQTIKTLKAAQVNRVAALLAKSEQSVVPVGMPLPENYVPPAASTKSKDGR